MDGDSTLERMRRTQKQTGNHRLQDSRTREKGNIAAAAAAAVPALGMKHLLPSV